MNWDDEQYFAKSTLWFANRPFTTSSSSYRMAFVMRVPIFFFELDMQEWAAIKDAMSSTKVFAKYGIL